MLHLRWVTDIHNTAAINRKGEDVRILRARTQEQLEIFIEDTRLNRPEMLIDTADDIESTKDAVQDAQLHAEMLDFFSPVKGIMAKPYGNHDCAATSREDLCSKFGFASSIVMRKYQDATVIVWDADPTPLRSKDRTFYTATENNLFDLGLALDVVPGNKPIFIFSHIPFHVAGNEDWLEDSERTNPTKSHYYNQEDILGLIKERHLKVICFAGHRHVTSHVAYDDNITFINMDRFVRPSTKPGRPEGVNTCDIIVDRGEVNVHMHGAIPRVYGF